jgi:hypothetical protein
MRPTTATRCARSSPAAAPGQRQTPAATPQRPAVQPLALPPAQGTAQGLSELGEAEACAFRAQHSCKYASAFASAKRLQHIKNADRAVVRRYGGERYYREVAAAFNRIETATVDLTSSGKSDRFSEHWAPSSPPNGCSRVCRVRRGSSRAGPSVPGRPPRPTISWPATVILTSSMARGSSRVSTSPSSPASALSPCAVRR